MFRPRPHAITLLFVTAALACSSPSQTISYTDTDAQTAMDAERVADGVVLPDLPAPDLAPELFFEVVNDLRAEVTPECAPGEGCFLDPCLENSDCLSGWCLDHLGGGVCSQSCSEECPPGFSCKQVGASDPDLVFACVSNFANLCRPCAASSDCKSVGGNEDVCVDYDAQGSFCGGGCELDDDCPAGYACQTATTVDGIELLQCINETGTCPCSAKSTALKLWTECTQENDWGICSGKRVCGEEGLGDCDATLPEDDLCDGMDNDCDGEIDEGTCDDGNPCTQDICNGADGCSNEPLTGGPCEDGDVCTIADHCDAGACVGTPVLCDDGNFCTDDFCDESGGCAFEPNTTDCDDGDPCTVGDECLDGACGGFALACDCQMDADCLALWDGNLCNGTLFCDQKEMPYQCAVQPGTPVTCPEPEGKDAICLAPVCTPESGKCSFVPTHEGFACDDGDACTIGDSCANGICTPGIAANCNDGNPCTDDACDEDTGCTHAPNQAPCDDDNACTTGDTCAGGGCAAGDAVVCDDDNVCTTDSCDSQNGCFFVPAPGACDDGNACTVGDSCQDGKCVPAGSLNCDDGDVCTNDSCDLVQGCVHLLNAAPCDDSDICTTGDHCHLGECISSGELTCNDNNPCTDDSCNANSGCQFVANSAACDDGNACTVTDACVGGACKGSGALFCDDDNLCTNDVCDPAAGCVFTVNTLPCDDGDACTIGDTCAGGTCSGTGDLVCNDDNPCTDDSCDANSGCQFVPNSVACDDGDACTTADTCSDSQCVGGPAPDCDDENVCTDDACEPKTGCSYTVNTAPCDDGDACTTGDTCAEGACQGPGELLCDDENPCTDDSCESDSGCLFTPNTLPCDDEDGCTLDDVCADGTCSGTSCADAGMKCVNGGCTSECFFDDFNDSDASDWQVLQGSWGFTTGKDGTPAYGMKSGNFTSGQATHVSLKGLQWFSIEMDFRVDWGAAGDFNLYMYEVDSEDSYNLGIYPKGSDSHPDQLSKYVSGVSTQVMSHAYTIGAGQWNTMTFTRLADGTLTVLLNGNPYMSGTDNDITGPLDLVVRFHANGFIDNIKVTCL
jgi:hypothetical protein